LIFVTILDALIGCMRKVTLDSQPATLNSNKNEHFIVFDYSKKKLFLNELILTKS